MKVVLMALLTASLLHCDKTKSSTKPDVLVGGGCEGCELYAEGMPSVLSWKTTLIHANEPGERIKFSGTMYKKDGTTPAANIIMYLYQTNSTGLYSPSPGQTAGARHGYIRGWIKTGRDGKYEFTTIKPAPYPNATIPAHIHPTIKEPNLNEYYVDDFEFDDDAFLTVQERSKREKRGGGGIITLHRDSTGILYGRRDIVLGKNIPNYPD